MGFGLGGWVGFGVGELVGEEVGGVVGSGEGTDVGAPVMNSRSGEENRFFEFHFRC